MERKSIHTLYLLYSTLYYYSSSYFSTLPISFELPFYSYSSFSEFFCKYIYIHIIYIHNYILYKFRQSHKIHTQNLNKLSEIVDPSSIIVIRIETHPDKKQKKCKKICMYVKLFFIYLVPVCASVCI